MEDVKAFYLALEADGIPKRYTHCMADAQVNFIIDSFFIPISFKHAACFCIHILICLLQLRNFMNWHLRKKCYNLEDLSRVWYCIVPLCENSKSCAIL